MSPALALVLLAVAVLGLSALVVAFVRVSARGKQAPPVWPIAAERLGLEAGTAPAGDGTLAGRFLGFEAEVTVESVSRERRRAEVRIVLSPSLDLGLALGSQPRLREAAPVGASPFATGNPTLDRILEPRARDARGARRLFERKALRDRLEAALRRWPAGAVGDGSVVLGAEGMLRDPLPVTELLDDAAAIARLVEEQRPRLKEA